MFGSGSLLAEGGGSLIWGPCMQSQTILFKTIIIMFAVSCSSKQLPLPDIGSETNVKVKKKQPFALTMGQGRDDLTGQKKEVCIDSSAVKVENVQVNSIESAVQIVRDSRELINSLNINTDTSISGAWGFFTGSASLSAAIEKNIKVSSHNVVAIAQLTYKKEELRIEDSTAVLKDEFAEILAAGDLTQFRDRCGDQLVRQASTGSRLLIMFTGTMLNQQQGSKKSIEAAAEVGFKLIFNGKSSTTVSTEQQDLINNMSVSARCYSEGAVSPSICSNFHVSGQDVTGDGLQEQIRIAREGFAQSINENDNHIVLGEGYNFYRQADPGGAFWESVKARAETLNKLVALDRRIYSSCNDIEFFSQECNQAKIDIASQVKSCALQELWSSQCKSEFSADEFGRGYDHIVHAGNAGRVDLYRDANFRGRKLELPINALYSPYSAYKADIVYNLTDPRFAFNDMVSSWKITLNPGWKITLYSNVNGRGNALEIDGNEDMAFISSQINDTISSFKMSRIQN